MNIRKAQTKYWVGCLLFFLFLQAQAQTPAGFADLHNSALYRLFAHNDVKGLENNKFAVNLHAMRQLNTKVMVFSMGIPRFSMQHPDTVSIAQVLAFMKKISIQIEQHYPQFQLIDKGKKEVHNKIRWMFALEGTHLLNGELHWVDSLYKVGVRMIGVGHWFHNHFLVNPNDVVYKNKVPEMINDYTMLSPKGKQLLERMIAKKIWIDVSHLRKRVFEQVVALNQGRTKLMASHSNAYKVCPVARNLTDAQIKAIAATGGLIGVCLHSPLIAREPTQASIAKLTDHIVYLIKKAGYKHVAIGSDFEGLIRPPKDLNKLVKVRRLAAEMRKRGLSKTVIEAVMWQNVTRVLNHRKF